MGKATRYWQETPAMTCQWKLGSSSGLLLRSHPDQDDGQRMPVHVPQCIRSIDKGQDKTGVRKEKERSGPFGIRIRRFCAKIQKCEGVSGRPRTQSRISTTRTRTILRGIFKGCGLLGDLSQHAAVRSRKATFSIFRRTNSQ